MATLIPADRVRDAKGIGEVDITNHALVWFRNPHDKKEMKRLWCKIEKGTRNLGRGVLVEEPKEDYLSDLKVGDTFEWKGGTSKKNAYVFKKVRRRNKLPALKQAVALDLQEAMMGGTIIRPTAYEKVRKGGFRRERIERLLNKKGNRHV